MAILNYTTQIKTETTIMEIERMLITHGAQRILKEYDGAGETISLSFMINTKKGVLPIRLPCDVQRVMQVINNQVNQYVNKNGYRKRVVPLKFKDDVAQARRVGWRIIKDWLEAQLALISLEMVEIQQIFLPYIVGLDGKTVYETIENKGFKGYLLEAHEQ